jgi:hypothetical protein
LSRTETVAEDPLEIILFPGPLKKSSIDALSQLVSEYGIVYVTSLTRDGCSGCQEQKPLFEALAAKMSGENAGKLKFRRIHVNYQENDKRNSWDAKRIFGHPGYPTYMVHVRSHVGPLEVYRSVYPSMEELEKQVKENLELAEFYKMEAEKVSRDA